MSKISAKHIFIGIMIQAYISGCASYQLDEAQHSLRSTFAARDFVKTVKLLENYENKGIYKIKTTCCLTWRWEWRSILTANTTAARPTCPRQKNRLSNSIPKA